MTISYDDYLMHHGVKGMKWGVRHDRVRKGRGRSRSNVGSQARPDTRSEDRKVIDSYRAKKRHELTDAELRQALNRMNMERQYKSLERELYHPGQDFAVKALKTTGKIAVGAVSGYAVNTVGKGLAKKGIGTAAGLMLRRQIRRTML